MHKPTNDGETAGIQTNGPIDATAVPATDPGIAHIEHQVAILLRRAALANRKSGGLDRAVYLLLRRLAEVGPAGVKTLADEFHLDISTVSRQVATMELKGLVLRIPDPSDHRACHLALTPAGQGVLTKELAARIDRYERLLAGWTAAERETFGALLSRLNQTFLD